MRSSDAWRERIRPPIGPRHRWTTNRTRRPKAIVVAVANQKGGVAKTTTVASLGAAWSQLGQRVLIVDLDPQACLTFLGYDPESIGISECIRC
jgi:chromosome partitioning protein